MISQAFGYVTTWFFSFFSLYSWLSIPLGIATYSGIALAMWSIVRFVIMPLVGSISFADSDGQDTITETITETISNNYSDAYPTIDLGAGVTRHHTVNRNKVSTTSTRTSRKVKRNG